MVDTMQVAKTYKGFSIILCEVEQENPYQTLRFQGVELHSVHFPNSLEQNSFGTGTEAQKEFINEVGNRFGEQINLVPVFGNEQILSLDPKDGEFIGYVEAPYYLSASDVQEFVWDMDNWQNCHEYSYEVQDEVGEIIAESCASETFEDAMAEAKEAIDTFLEEMKGE